MDITGNWYNELGSEMQIQVTSGTVTGRYQTAVGNAEGIYALSGRTEYDNTNDKQNIGFAVSWQNKYGNSQSVTSWSGQVQVIDDIQVMRTTWLLTRETDPNDNWASTMVSIDVFTRKPPSAETIAHAKKWGMTPHPRT